MKPSYYPDLPPMDKRITLQTRSTVQDSVGGVSDTWTDFQTVWADVAPAKNIPGEEHSTAGSRRPEVKYIITLRWQSWMTDPGRISAMRAVLGSRIFELQGNLDVRERHVAVRIYATEGMTDG